MTNNSGTHFGSGRIEVITGPMFAGKSEELIRRVKRSLIARKHIQVFKSMLDDRGGHIRQVASHDGRTVAATPIRTADEILVGLDQDTEVVAIDEVQFLDERILDVVTRLADAGIIVIAAGIDTDYRGLPFGPMAQLLAIAERVDKLSAVCIVCGEEATRNQRLVNGMPAPPNLPTIHVGAGEDYESRCRSCHVVPETVEESAATA